MARTDLIEPKIPPKEKISWEEFLAWIETNSPQKINSIHKALRETRRAFLFDTLAQAFYTVCSER